MNGFKKLLKFFNVVLGEQGDSRNPVGALRAEIESIRQAELARYRRLHPGIPPEVLDAITRSLIEKVMHQPTVRLKTLDPETAREFSALFSTQN